MKEHFGFQFKESKSIDFEAEFSEDIAQRGHLAIE